jgi:hypothetical protein
MTIQAFGLPLSPAAGELSILELASFSGFLGRGVVELPGSLLGQSTGKDDQ